MSRDATSKNSKKRKKSGKEKGGVVMTLAHELGHTLSLAHSNAEECGLMRRTQLGVALSNNEVKAARLVALSGEGFVKPRILRCVACV